MSKQPFRTDGTYPEDVQLGSPTKGVVDAELKNFRSGNPSMKLGLSIGTQEELRTTLISISKRRLPFIGEEGAYDEYSFRLEDLQALLKAQLASLLAEAKPVIYPMAKARDEDGLVPANEYPKAVPANIIKQKMGELDA